MILSATLYCFENAERASVPSVSQVLAQPPQVLSSGLKSSQILRQKALQFFLAGAW